jgi:copper resistance protein C
MVTRTALFHARATRALFIGLLTLAASTPLLAHLAVKKTSPAKDTAVEASPEYIQVWFTEKPELSLSVLSVAGAAGAVELSPVEAADANSVRAAVKKPLAKGAYTVSWKTAGTDGHVLRGEFKFTVGAITTP